MAKKSVTRKNKSRKGGTTPRSGSSGRSNTVRRTGRNLMGALEAAASPARSSSPRDLLAELEAAASPARSASPVDLMQQLQREAVLLDSADMEREMEQQIQASANFLKEEHENGVRVCYTGQYQVPRDGRVKEKSDGIYTIKQFLKLGTDMVESEEQKYEQLMRMGLLPRPQYGDKFKTQQDLESLVASLDASYCTAQPRNPLTAHLPTCKTCERLLKARVTNYNHDEDFALIEQERIERAKYFERLHRKNELKTKRAALMREARQALPGARASLAAFDRERRQSSEARRTRRAARGARREARESRRTGRRTTRRSSPRTPR